MSVAKRCARMQRHALLQHLMLRCRLWLCRALLSTPLYAEQVMAQHIPSRPCTSAMLALTRIRERYLASSNDKDANICLRSSTNHVGDIVFVAGRVQNCIPLLLGLKMRSAHLNSLSLGSLLLVGVHDVSHVPTLPVLFLSFPAVTG